MAVKTYSYKKDGNKQITAHFKVKEFRCKDGTDKILVSIELVEMLEKLRSKLNCIIDINSGYRTVSHNKEIGGSSTSKHCKGLAADIICRRDGKTVPAKEVCCAAQDLNFPGIAYITAGATHVDVRTGKWWADESKNNRIVKDFYSYFNIVKPAETYKGTFPKLPFLGCLKYGNQGEQVEHLQRFLNWCIDADLDPDGSFGPATQAAVGKFQRTYGLTVDYKFGPASLRKAKTIKK